MSSSAVSVPVMSFPASNLCWGCQLKDASPADCEGVKVCPDCREDYRPREDFSQVPETSTSYEHHILEYRLSSTDDLSSSSYAYTPLPRWITPEMIQTAQQADDDSLKELLSGFIPTIVGQACFALTVVDRRANYGTPEWLWDGIKQLE